MKLYKEEASQQGSPKRQKDPSVAAWPWSSLCHQRHMCRAAEGLFQRVVHLTLLEHPMASLRFSGDKRRCLNSNTNHFVHIPHVHFYPCPQGEYVFCFMGGSSINPILTHEVIPGETQGHGKTKCLFASCSCQTGENHRVWLGWHLLIILLLELRWVHL